MPAIREELARLDLAIRCDDATSSCAYCQALDDQGACADVILLYSRKTDTVYVAIDRFIVLRDSRSPPLSLALRLLELNREMIAAKFEWDRPNGSIRLSVVLNTDSNFDRRAFRSSILGLGALAKKLRPELQRLAETSAPTPASPDEEQTKIDANAKQP